MRFIIGVVIAAVIWFVWGYVFWMIIPYANSVIEPIPQQEMVATALGATGMKDGVYKLPGGDPNDEQTRELFAAGPIATLLYRAEGQDPMDPRTFVLGFLHYLGSAFLLGIILATAGRRTFFGRYMLVIWIGLFVAIWAEMSDVIWSGYPLEYACLKQTYHISSLLIVGAILAIFTSPPADPTVD